MAIAFARPEYVGRSDNKNACCKSSYNSRSKIVDERAGKVFNFTNHGGNAYHEMLLPEYVDKKFKNAEGFSNEVERAEKRKDSQLYVEWLLALPKEKEITLEMKKEIIKEFIERKGWIKEGLGVQIDIHEPHDGEKNWHAHLLVTTRRFKKDGLGLEDKKAVDLQPEIKYGKVQKTAEIDNHKFYESVLNDKFKAWGLDLRADLPGEITQEHVGPVRMRSIFNEAVQRNEERVEAEINHLNSGARVLEKVTKHMSVFTKGDLVRAVKYIPNSEAKSRLVEDALSDKSVVPLYREEGNKTKYFTTEAVRAEENKIFRLSQYVANESNVFTGASSKSVNYNNLLAGISSNAGLSEEQSAALSNLILTESGIRILRGRAGAGKSFVLKQIPLIAEYAGVNVIGVAPTHKAKLELASDGFKNTDTIKGMLFKLANGRFSLPKHSLIVVDEAGMVGNDDYRELLRVAATRKCNVIAAGDEKQLASVQRGGMFEVFADRYGSSSILDIKRQDSDWGKSVAINMSAGNVETAISILDRENCIKWDADRDSSMNALLADWSKSDCDISDRLILAVKNKDVAALNHGARQYLKLEGKLTGNEILVAGNHYMKGDKILITKTNKELGLINGDLAELVLASGGKFTIKLAGGAKDQDDKKISFNPSEYNGFRHGYATTVFKAQAASIKGVYVYHDGFAGIRNSYVALSRFVEELKLYANTKSTSNLNSLVRQLSQDAEAGSSLSYLTKKELEYNRISHKLANDKNRFVRGFNSLIDFASNAATKFTDKYIPSSQYYNYKEPKSKYEPVSQAIEKTYNEIEEHNQAIMEEKMVIGGNNHVTSNQNVSGVDRASILSANKEISGDIDRKITSQVSNNIRASSNNHKTRESAQVRFYRNVDRVRAQKQYEAQKEEWGREYDQLKSELKYKSEAIARDLLGDPNKRLSNGMELRYGDHGKLAVRITGEKAGTWYDFAKGEGGELFHLAQEVRKTSFKEAADYLRGQVGMSKFSSFKPNLQLLHDHTNSDLTIDHIKNKEKEERVEEQKRAYSTKLYDRSKDIGEKSVAHRYLTITRNINVDLGDDIKTAGIYERSKKGYLPALVAFARDKDGNITGGQHILLDKDTGGKADIDVPKKSFGKISGAFVDLGNTNAKANKSNADITIIAEGVETGLSVKQALSEHGGKGNKLNKISINTLCSLGISNIKNYAASKGEKLIIASDNDGKNSITEKTIETAKSALEEKGAFVEIVKPEKYGDFNDVLKDKENGGSKVIADCFKHSIAKHSSQTLQEYIVDSKQNENSSRAKDEQLSIADKANLAIIEKYNISQEAILNAWRMNPEKGKEELKFAALEISLTEKRLEANRDILDLATNHGIKVDEANLVKTLLTSPASCQQECINHVLSGFAKQKQESGKTGDVFNIIKKENKFLSEVNIKGAEELDKNLKDRLDLSKTEKSKDIIASIKQNIEANHKQGIISYDDLLKKVVASGYDIKGLDVVLNQLAVNGRSKYLEAISIELNELKKLKCNPDQDKLVGSLKSMSYKEREQYGDKLLGEAAKQHIEPILNRYSNERNNAGNFWKFLNIVAKEQESYKEMYSNHRFALRSLDRQNGDLKFSTIGSSACQIDKRLSTKSVISMLGFAVKNNIVSEEKITKEINLRKGDLSSIYYHTKSMCDDYRSQQTKNDMTKQNAPEKEKQPEIKIDKGFSM